MKLEFKVNSPCQMVQLVDVSPIQYQVVPYALADENSVYYIEDPVS